MQKKVNVLLVMPILIILFSIGFISAASCSIVERGSCTGNIVMGVSSLTNAHGEFPDVGTYNYVLCCDFGTGNIICDNNKIVGLSSVTNAHAEIPTETTYLVEVCYEDLKCISTSDTCPNDPSSPDTWYPLEMISLSSFTNAHIGEFNDYPIYYICCSSTTYTLPPCSLTSAYWSLDGITPITAENTALTNQNVHLIVEGTNCAGETISFEVLEYDAGGTTPVTTNPENVQFGSNAMWTAEWMNDGLFQGNPEYYFIATVVGSSPLEKIESSDPKLVVKSESVEDYCLSISSCEDYNEKYCNADPCTVAELGGEFCDEYLCSCSWDDVEEMCKTSYSSIGECGDGVINRGEQCETDEDITLSCNDFGFTGGDLQCIDCMIDTSGCTGELGEGICGDGTVNLGEQCESEADLVGISCSDFDDFSGEDLACYPAGSEKECLIDTSGCTGVEIGGGTCSMTQIVESECEEPPEGLFIYSWTGIWTGSDGTAKDECEAGGESITIECPAPIKLPFFNFYNIIITLILIALIYVSLIFKRKKK